MSLPSVLPKIQIKSNSIDVSSSYTYDAAMNLNGASALVKDNFISGCVGTSTASTNLVSVNNASCIFTGNQFVRGSSSLNSYINISGTNDQIITGNIFDNSTASASDEFLVKNLTENSTYNNNKNQIGYAVIHLANHVYDNAATNYNSTSYMTQFSPGTNGIKYVKFKVSINNFIPKGSQIKLIKIGLSASNYMGGVLNAGSGYNKLTLQVDTNHKHIENITSGTNSILDTSNLVNTSWNSFNDVYDFDSLSEFANLQSSAKYLTSSINSQMNSSDELADVVADIFLAVDFTTNYEDFFLSPLVVKYSY